MRLRRRNRKLRIEECYVRMLPEPSFARKLNIVSYLRGKFIKRKVEVLLQVNPEVNNEELAFLLIGDLYGKELEDGVRVHQERRRRNGNPLRWGESLAK